LANGSCNAIINANGVATCGIVLVAPAVLSLTAAYGGDSASVPATASKVFLVLAGSIFANGFEAP
jgi:hypothetical protein